MAFAGDKRLAAPSPGGPGRGRVKESQHLIHVDRHTSAFSPRAASEVWIIFDPSQEQRAQCCCPKKGATSDRTQLYDQYLITRDHDATVESLDGTFLGHHELGKRCPPHSDLGEHPYADVHLAPACLVY